MAYTLNRDFLEDYDADERKQQLEFGQRVSSRRLETDERYPPLSRFPKIRVPYASSCSGVSIWPQIPLFGSLIINVFPRESRLFEFAHGFRPSEIQRLVEYHKSTGKVQFALAGYPRAFSGLDYLDPILSLRPPVVAGTSVALRPDDRTYRASGVEFMTLAKLGFLQHLRKMGDGVPRSYMFDKVYELAKIYALLKTKGFPEVASEIEVNLVEDPAAALELLQLSGALLIQPQIDYLKSIRIYSREQLASASKYSALSHLARKALPYEIGSFLMQKLTFQPESFDACMDLVSRFDHLDLQNVMSALYTGATKKNKEILRESGSKLNDIFDQVWQDGAKVAARVELAKYLVPISVAAVGVILEKYPGVLGGLGFAIADKILAKKEQSISERIARSISPGYAFALFDFQKRYSVIDKRPLN